jgi:uncharacterized SAM-binding protein YcdF (DUF218 family)
MYELAKLAEYLLSPLTVAMGLWLLAGLCLALRRRTLAVALASIAFIGLWLGAMPVVARALTGALEAQYPALTVEATPSADAIVVLGGALILARPPQRPSFGLGPAAARVWHAAELHRAGKAKWIVLAAGGLQDDPDQPVEADAMSQMLVTLGVPEAAIRRETASRTTRDNARNVLPILKKLGARRILLVTSAQHMPRAVKTFTKVSVAREVEIVPCTTDIQVTDPAEYGSISMWLPTPGALLGVTAALKEYAGLLALDIM